MKNLILFISILTLLSIFTSCTKDNNTPTNTVINNPSPVTYDITGAWKDSTNTGATSRDSSGKPNTFVTISGTNTYINGADYYSHGNAIKLTIDNTNKTVSIDNDYQNGGKTYHISGTGNIKSNNEFTLLITNTILPSMITQPIFHKYRRI